MPKEHLSNYKDIPKEIIPRILSAIRRLEDSETWGDVKRLVNHEYQFRLRVGEYRVLFDLTQDGEIHIVLVQEIKKRNEGTY